MNSEADMTTLPTTMKAMAATAFSLDAIEAITRDVPAPKRGEILVKISAASLNYRDLAVLGGNYIAGLPLPLVPASDACGTVVALGEGVTEWQLGDRVTPVYTQGWHDGKPTPVQRSRQTLGAPLSGVLQQYLTVPADDAVMPPASLSDIEAATLPIAALTAWSALQEGAVKPGDTVLLQGTGGVSLFALQFAKAAGARVIITSSSDEKLKRVTALGADVAINYRKHPDWESQVKAATGGRGVDIVVETGGSTLPQSLAATAFGGFVAIVGFVAGYEATISLRQLIGPMIRVQGIAVGSKAAFVQMNRAIAQNGIKPVIDSVYALDDVKAAFMHMASGSHFGKVAVSGF
jgi:NADPH:quinone reductase-like Zn-dependent oxidoreductase